nr:hypothetical protein [Aeropyrum camini]
MTPEFVLRLARAIGAYFGRGSRILVGRDTRSGGSFSRVLWPLALLSRVLTCIWPVFFPRLLYSFTLGIMVSTAGL